MKARRRTMSIYKSRTLFICKTECYECKKEYNAAYVKAIYDDSFNEIVSLSPNSFSDEEKKIAEENGVIIERRSYEHQYDVDIYTVSVCPHCRTPFGNNHIKELIGKEIKEIVIK